MTCSYRLSPNTALLSALLCKDLGVRRPAFYEWLAGDPARAARTAAAAAEEELATEIAEVHAEHRSAYGCPRVTVKIAAVAGRSAINASNGSCISARSSA